jgi:hypothetical protein
VVAPANPRAPTEAAELTAGALCSPPCTHWPPGTASAAYCLARVGADGQRLEGQGSARLRPGCSVLPPVAVFCTPRAQKRQDIALFRFLEAALNLRVVGSVSKRLTTRLRRLPDRRSSAVMDPDCSRPRMSSTAAGPEPSAGLAAVARQCPENHLFFETPGSGSSPVAVSPDSGKWGSLPTTVDLEGSLRMVSVCVRPNGTRAPSPAPQPPY